MTLRMERLEWMPEAMDVDLVTDWGLNGSQTEIWAFLSLFLSLSLPFFLLLFLKIF